jgi:hypothetical protein
MSALNPPKSSAAEQELPAPESDSRLAELATTLSETVVILHSGQLDTYGVVRKSQATTSQSDYFRIQFKAFADVAGRDWKKLAGEEATFHQSSDCAWAMVDHPSKSVLFGPRTGISCSPRFRNSNLDNYLFAQAILWAKQNYPNYGITPGGVSLSARGGMDERLQRSTFYVSQGFDFAWLDDEQRMGRFTKERVSKLLGAWDPRLVEEVPGETLLDGLAAQAKVYDEQEQRLSALQTSYTNIRDQLVREQRNNQILIGVGLCMLLIGVMFAIGLL